MSLWQQFVEQKAKWIGGTLTDFDGEPASTEIVDITLVPNGSDSSFFEFVGEKFSCGFDVHHGGLTGEHVEHGMMFSRNYMGCFSVTLSPRHIAIESTKQ